MKYKEGSYEIEERQILLMGMDNIDNTYGQKCLYPMDKNVPTPMDKNVQDNNTYINNTINNTVERNQINNNESTSSLLKKENNNKNNKGPTASTSPQTVRPLLKANYPDYESLVDWYDYVGSRKRLSFKQIEDKVKKLEDECGHNSYIVDQQINISYQNNYVSFFPPKEGKKKFYSSSVSTNIDTTDDSEYVAL